ncbi:M15 family metallopeptidase [Shewanella sp. 1CM18E]|uniref:M15 family metallopeptidase n=1 Tax=Shewanella sp. 1CM18E TaxID=2929169 RepID=UPI0020C08577|nr:M15 family metallopeptidase [Shewanella sp. 1CM18E]MCK8046488.1 M15 family metallopeptidase [Shewanella sp. 1CM18E]
MQINQSVLYGLDNQHFVDCLSHRLERQTAAAFLLMQQAAKADNIDLQICSAFRDFDRQQFIWNNKVNGKRPVLNRDSVAVDITLLTPNELIEHILIWSAIPGMSRHHWGTDIDIFDGNMITKQDLQLISAEYQQGGPCYKLSRWLDKHAQEFGFYLPFQAGLSGVSPEAWHLSYYPVADKYTQSFDSTALKRVLASSSVNLKEYILPQLDALIAEYVYRVAPSPAS